MWRKMKENKCWFYLDSASAVMDVDADLSDF